MNITTKPPVEKPPDIGTCSDLVDRLRASEVARCRIAFEQYELAAQLLGERAAERITAGLPQDRWETGVAGEIALALHISPSHGVSLLSRARELRRHLPHTRERLRAGDLSPEAVRAVIGGVAHLDAADRERADALLCADPHTLAGMGLKRLRNRGQDVAYERLTGRSVADGQDVTVNLTVPAAVLLGDQPGTAHLDGGGSLPAEIARKIVATATAKGRTWVKRLYVRPESGTVVGLDSRARRFPQGLADLIAARDQYCRTPYCDAPIAHIDHVHRHASGGATAFENGQGLCASCNQAKEGPGWRARTVDDASGRHTVETRTPSGHQYRSTAPRHAGVER